ncbi:MAG: HypC/HybG/HupF family hydrogenase formation chaperone [Phycisphaeraceae bacterium]
MCLAIPGQIIEIVDDAADIAKVDVSGVRRNISIALVRPEGAKVGDWVLVHVGFALSLIDEQQALETLAFLETLGSEYEQERDEFKRSQIE